MKTKFLLLLFFTTVTAWGQQMYFISPTGNDNADGTINSPLQKISNAIEKGRKSKESNIIIYLREGKYYLDSPLIINGKDWKNNRLQLSAYNNEQVIISGGKEIFPRWEKGTGKIWKTVTEVHNGDQLFVNGKKRVLARYPNFVEGEIFNGTAEDAISPLHTKKWKSPEGGFIHALHGREWGDMHYVITRKDKEGIHYTGGQQNNRPSEMHKKYRFVENIYEELDAQGEWFLNNRTGYLFYYPLEGEKIDDETFELSEIPHLIEMKGEAGNPVCDISIKGIHFTQTSRSFMAEYEPLLRSDWSIYRGAAIFIDNARRCTIQDCEFSHLGGNAIFLSRYADSCVIKSNHIYEIGASAICVVGDTSAVRSGSFKYEQNIPFPLLDKTPGPRNEKYPRRCIIEDNLIHDIGQVEKQVAGVQIQIAQEIAVRHNSIYRVPRAAINVGNGTFGGHMIEYNDAFATVLETSDHGAFNSWGRDRFWQPSYQAMSRTVSKHPELILLDALYTTYIRYNRFRCDHGWDIDLDDGSSNYHIYGNVCLSGGIKLREGFNRIVENNIVINNTLHPHLWFKDCGDIIRRNIFTQAYLPIQLNSHGKMMDYNFFSSQKALETVRKDSTDMHSLSGVLTFTDYKNYDFTLPEKSLAFNVGFENLPLDCYGVYTPRLKQMAEKPKLSELLISNSENQQQAYVWQKANIRMINNLGDRSAYGLPDSKGIIILNLSNAPYMVKAGLQDQDVIYSIYGEGIDSIESLMRLTNKYKWKKTLSIECFRNQQPISLVLPIE